MIPFVYQLYFLSVFLTGIYGCYNFYNTEGFLTYLFVFCIVNSYYTFGEYVIHRYLFHNLFEKLHNKYHKEPKKYYRLFIPIHITLLNDIMLCLISYFLFPRFFSGIMSSAHFSYLLFEATHYVAHYSSESKLSFLFPKRLISFHYFHHTDDDYNYGFTTPFWDILFEKNKSRFPFKEYPLSIFPLSVVSFLSLDEIEHLLVISSNIVYLFPAYVVRDNDLFLFYFYLSMGIVSSIYHSVPCFLTKVVDHLFASAYFLISFYMWITLNLFNYTEPYVWLFLSAVMYVVDNSKYTSNIVHILWHIFTGVGVGRMYMLK